MLIRPIWLVVSVLPDHLQYRLFGQPMLPGDSWALPRNTKEGNLTRCQSLLHRTNVRMSALKGRLSRRKSEQALGTSENGLPNQVCDRYRRRGEQGDFFKMFHDGLIF